MGRFERVTADLQEMQEKNAGLKAMDTQCMVSITQTLAAMYDLLDEKLSGLDRIQAAAGGITFQQSPEIVPLSKNGQPDIGKLAEEVVYGSDETNEEI
jgi:hypothetical protein